jgi:hypothetical protein
MLYLLLLNPRQWKSKNMQTSAEDVSGHFHGNASPACRFCWRWPCSPKRRCKHRRRSIACRSTASRARPSVAELSSRRQLGSPIRAKLLLYPFTNSTPEFFTLLLRMVARAVLCQAGFLILATRQTWHRFGWYVVRKDGNAVHGQSQTCS